MIGGRATPLWVGTDVVDLDRFRLALGRTPALEARLFTAGERRYAARGRDPAKALAARFAAKEATMKALGVGLGAFGFHDVEVVRAESGEPTLEVRGPAADLAAARSISMWRVSLTHSELVAMAVVIGQ